MKPTRYLLKAAMAAALLCGQGAALAAEPSATTLALPADWYPESLATGPDGSFYVGSWRQGAVARISPQGGAPEILVKSGSNGLANGQGVLVDAARRLLWICSGNLGYTTVPSTPSALKSYDLDSGEPRASYPMPDKGYCNDLVQDRNGTLYVTDSFHPRVLRLKPGEMALQIWKEDLALSAGDGGFFLNGITLDGDRQLYVSEVAAKPWLRRIAIEPDGSAGALTRIDMPRTLKNADAIRSAGPGRLVIFESNAFGKDGPYGGQVSVAKVSGNSASVETIVAGLNDPSSGVIVGDRVYFIESKYSLLFSHANDDAKVPRNVPFAIQSRTLPR